MTFPRYNPRPSGQVAQSVEQRIENPCVDGSIPPLATRISDFDWKYLTLRVLLVVLVWTKNMPGIRVKENEPFEVAVRRFKRAIEKTGLLTELRAREFYEKPTTERKRKAAAAVKRHHKRIRSQTLPPKLY